MRIEKHLSLIVIGSVAYVIFSHVVINTDSFLSFLGEHIYACIPMGIFVVCSSYHLLALFILFSTFFWKAFLHNKQVGLKIIVSVYSTSLLFTAFIPFSNYAYIEVMSGIQGRKLHQQWLSAIPEVRANYEITDFSEEPVPIMKA
jgi:hypothetical protein